MRKIDRIMRKIETEIKPAGDYKYPAVILRRTDEPEPFAIFCNAPLSESMLEAVRLTKRYESRAAELDSLCIHSALASIL